MKITKVCILTLSAFLSACTNMPESNLTPLEIQSLQSREYESSSDIVFKSVMSVFQDLGYIIRSADKDTGFITAESAAKSDAAMKFWLGITDVSQTSATAFVEQIGTLTRVRLNFVNSSKQSSWSGQADREDTPILNAKVYQVAFEKIENAIFVRSES